MGFQKILVAIDSSPLSQAVFEQALDLAKTNQAQLLLLHCLTADLVAASPSFAGELGLSPHLTSRTADQSQYMRFDQQMQQIQLLLNQYQQTATQQGVRVEWDCRTIEPGQGLCQTAQRWNADLIVLGRRGRRGLSEVLLGSVSNYVMHHAPCAVLVIQPTQTVSVASATALTQETT